MKLTIDYEALEALYNETPSLKDLWDKASLLGYVTGDVKEPEVTNLFSIMYKQFRIKAKHKGINQIRKGNSQYSLLEDIVMDAMVFCKEFGFTYRQGFFKFLSIASDQGWLKLNTLKYKGDKISDLMSVEREILDDSNEEITFRLKNAFSQYNLINYSYPLEDQDNPLTHVHFVRAAKVCVKENVSPSTFINKVGEIWSWTAQPLEPKNLYSKHTMNNLYLGDVPKVSKVVTVKLKKGFERYD